MDSLRPYTSAIDNWVDDNTQAFVVIVTVVGLLFLLACFCCMLFAATQCIALVRCLLCCCCCCCGGRQSAESDAHTCCNDMESGALQQRALFSITGDDDEGL